MKRTIALAKAVCGKLCTGFVKSRLLAELQGTDELIYVQLDHPSDDPRTSGGLPGVGLS